MKHSDLIAPSRRAFLGKAGGATLSVAAIAFLAGNETLAQGAPGHPAGHEHPQRCTRTRTRGNQRLPARRAKRAARQAGARCGGVIPEPSQRPSRRPHRDDPQAGRYARHGKVARRVCKGAQGRDVEVAGRCTRAGRATRARCDQRLPRRHSGVQGHGSRKDRRPARRRRDHALVDSCERTRQADAHGRADLWCVEVPRATQSKRTACGAAIWGAREGLP